jgi:chromosome segregation ATPase
MADDTLPAHLLSEGNKQLTSQIGHYEGEVERIHREIDEHRERLKFMTDHLTNVKSEIINTQQLQDAKRKEIETEDHLAQLAERERGRVKQRTGQLVTQQQKQREGIDSLQNRIFQGNLRIDEFKAAMNFNQEELEQWDLARRQKEDDNDVLMKYQQQDDRKLKGLNLDVEKLSKELRKREAELEREVTETRGVQIELDKTSEDYKAAHMERNYLLQQWEEAVKAMHRRDKAIEAAEERYAEGKQWLEKRNKQLKSRIEFHQVENANNKELEVKIAQEERVLAKYREDTAALAKQLSELNDEVEVVRNTLAKAVKERSRLKGDKQEHEETFATRQATFNRAQQNHEKVVAKLQDELEAASDLERQNALVADLVAETEKSLKSLDKETARVKDEQYQQSQQLFSVRKQQSTYLAEISGAQAQGKNMAAKIAQLDQESFKQQELLYSIEFNVQQMERKVNRAKGERTEEEKRELQEKIDMLQEMLENLLKQHKVLDVQVTRVTDDLRQAKQVNVKLEVDKKRVTEELLELTLENESCQIELGKMTKVKEEALVQGDVLKLQVESLKRILLKSGGELLGLENRRQQLKLTVQEREAEIVVHHDVLRMEFKTAEEERKAVQAELRQRVEQVKHLKNRHDVLTGRMAKDAAETTHAQHIVKTAKEREELQAQGDALDAEIKRVEREGRKLDKVIAQFKGSNATFKHQFTKVAETDDEVVEQKLLHKKNKDLQTVINRRTAEAKNAMRTEMATAGELQERQRERDDTAQQVDVLREGEQGLMQEIDQIKNTVATLDLAIARDVKGVDDPDIVEDIKQLEETDRVEQLVGMLVRVGSARGDEAQRIVEGTLSRYEIDY